MPAKYQSYPEYKDSGVEWFGEVPNHWKVAGFKKYLRKIVDYRGKTPNKTDNGVMLVTARNIKNGSLDYSLSQEFIAEEDYDDVMSRGKPNIGDVLFTTEAPLGEVANIDRLNIALAQRVIKFCGKDGILDNYYFKYLIMSQEFQQSLYLFASGSTVKGIKAERFVYLRKLLPPIDEQKQIANFLDHETAKIDTLIEKQQQLIKLLKEKRQAVISHAVTKGLNPNAPMKDSGIEWLGQVPKHWEVTQIKHIAELNPSKGEIENKKNTQCNFVPMEKLKTDSLVLDETRLINDVYDGYTYFVDEDILMAKVTPCFENKNITIARNMKNGIGFGSSEIYVLRCNDKVINRFLFYRLQEDTFMELAAGSMTGAGGLKRVPSDMLNNFTLALPPVQEQQAILDTIEGMLNTLKTLEIKSEQAIELMQERRTALISAAVTGKIDVRHHGFQQ